MTPCIQLRRACYLLLLVVVCAMPVALAQRNATKQSVAKREPTLTFAERVAYQRAIEDVYWRNRIWPKANASPKPPLDKAMSQAQIEKKVEDYLSNSQALEDYWQRPITPDQLQAEIERIASHTRQPEVLREIFAALGNDPFVIAECLARPVLAERLLTEMNDEDCVKLTKIAWRKQPFASMGYQSGNAVPVTMAAVSASYTLPAISGQSDRWSPSRVCTDDTWTPTSLTNAPDTRASHTAVWTGSEMIIWGGSPDDGTTTWNTGGRYNPSTDSWTATSTTNAPSARESHTAVWTGSEMIVWGGGGNCGNSCNTGGRYNPSTDSWTATSTTNAPTGRDSHTAVWTGNEMIIWGGEEFGNVLDTGGRYNPGTDSWTATNTTNAPAGRDFHTAVWTGSEVIVWGGYDAVHPPANSLNTGGRYNPSTDSWTATSTTNAPSARGGHTAVWTGSEMIIWAGAGNAGFFNTGGRYNPSTDSWTATSTTNAPADRNGHTAVWTGSPLSQMIVWGGYHFQGGDQWLNTGGRYNPNTDSWTATSLTSAPIGRNGHTAVWDDLDAQMIIWGGFGGFNIGSLNTGGRYCAAAPRSTPTPRPRPTPHPRP